MTQFRQKYTKTENRQQNCCRKMLVTKEHLVVIGALIALSLFQSPWQQIDAKT